MVEVWRDPSITKGENNFYKKGGLRVEDGIRDNKKKPLIISGKGRVGSAREDAEEKFRKMTSGKKVA